MCHVQILIPASIAERLAGILGRRGLVECGGVLMGEHVSEGKFRIVDFTVQRSKGSFASFLRIPRLHIRGLNRFFQRTGNNFCRFNYLGEWHSHPAFDTRPSSSDTATMHTLVNDGETGATFAILLIVRLSGPAMLQAGAYLFLPGNPSVPMLPLVLEAGDRDDERRRTMVKQPSLGSRVLTLICDLTIEKHREIKLMDSRRSPGIDAEED